MDTQTLTQTGAYTVWVSHVGTNFGSVTLQLKSVPANITGSITIDGSAVTAATTAPTTAPGQDIKLTFSPPVNQRLVLYATAVSNPSAGANIMNPDGTQHAYIGVNNSGYPNNSFFMDTQTLT